MPPPPFQLSFQTEPRPFGGFGGGGYKEGKKNVFQKQIGEGEEGEGRGVVQHASHQAVLTTITKVFN